MRHLPTVASATLALLLGSGSAPAYAACDPATRAVQYLHTVQHADGSIDGSLSETADYAIGAAADGIDPNTLASSAGKSPFDYFLADVNGAQNSLQDANILGKLIQVLVAGHRDPHSFGGINLLDRLINGKTPGGSPQSYYNSLTGVFLDAISGGPNQAFTQANAILGLDAANDTGFKVPAKAITELDSLQSSSGGWSAFGSFDTNTTSMAMMALVGSGHNPTSDPTIFANAFGFLLSQQDPASGGFTFTTSFGTTSDPASDGLVIQALVAAGQDPSATKWTNAKGNAPTDILSFQDPATGGFVSPPTPGVQAFATTQAIDGLRAAPFPISGSYVSGAQLPAAGCPAPAPAAVLAAPATPAPHLPAAGRRTTTPPGPRTPAPAGLLLLLLLLTPVVTAATLGRVHLAAQVGWPLR